MNRIGINANNPEECANIINKYTKKLNITGLFTHLCVADSEDEESIAFTKNQISKFNKVVESVNDLNIEVIHCLYSAGME